MVAQLILLVARSAPDAEGIVVVHRHVGHPHPYPRAAVQVLFQPVYLVPAVIINRQPVALRIPYVPGGYVVINFTLPVACRVILVTDVAAGFINIADLSIYAPVYIGDSFVAVRKQVTNLVIGIAGAAFQVVAVIVTAGGVVCYARQLVVEQLALSVPAYRRSG